MSHSKRKKMQTIFFRKHFTVRIENVNPTPALVREGHDDDELFLPND